MDKAEIVTDIAPVLANAVNAGVNYIEKHPAIKTFVLGVSGGVDSAVAAAVARMVCNRTNVRLRGVFLLISGNTVQESMRAKGVCEEYCHDFEVINLDTAFYNTMNELDIKLCNSYLKKPSHEEKIRAGNFKARLRMMYLYNLASKHSGLVLSTDNLTEYFLGFWTLHGDVGDLGLIQNLWKTEVYMLGDLIGGACTACVNAIPTDGLGITDSDFDQLLPEWSSEMGDHRMAYEYIDDLLIDYFNGGIKNNVVAKRCIATRFKRLNPVNTNRSELLG